MATAGQHQAEQTPAVPPPAAAVDHDARRLEHDRQRRLVIASLLACPPS